MHHRPEGKPCRDPYDFFIASPIEFNVDMEAGLEKDWPVR